MHPKPRNRSLVRRLFPLPSGLITSPHVAQWPARLKGERARGSRGGAVARRLLALSSSQLLD